jgi:hypothetical protein
MLKSENTIKYSSYKAFSLIEALLAVALFSASASMMITTMISAQDSNLAAANLNKASLMAEEGLDAVKSIRNEFFTNITDGDYQIAITSGAYTLQPGIETIDTFTRQVTIDSNALDTYHKRVTVEVTYPNRTGANRLVQAQTIITDWQRTISTGTNTWISPIITIENDIDGNGDLRDLIIDGDYLYGLRSTNDEIVVFDISDPAIVTELDSLSIDAGPYTMVKRDDFLYIASSANGQEVAVIDVSNPNNIKRVDEIDLSKNNNNVDGVLTDPSDNIYIAVRNYGRSSLPSKPKSTQQYTLYAYDNSKPKKLSLESTYMQLGSKVKIYNAEIKDDYVFLGTNQSSKEIIVVDVSDIYNMTESHFIDLPGNDDVSALKILGDLMLIGTTDGYAYIYSVANPASPVLISSITLTNKVHSIMKVEDYLLIAVEDGWTTKLEVYDMSNQSSPSFVSETDIRSDIKDIAYDPINNLLYLGTVNNTRELVQIEPS